MSEQIAPIYARIAFCGESNSGKTMSAMILAMELASSPDKISIIDTESRAKLYRKLYPGIKIVEIKGPYDPEKMIEALQTEVKAKAEVVIIDNSSQVWEQMILHADNMALTIKNSMLIWKKLTPRWNSYINAINDAPVHVLTTYKMKDKITQQGSQIVNLGKQVVSRGGNKAIKYDYQVVFTLGDDHKATVVKDNLALFGDTPPAMLTKEVGKKLAKWYKEA